MDLSPFLPLGQVALGVESVLTPALAILGLRDAVAPKPKSMKLKSCFPAGTPIHTRAGQKAIEQVGAGDWVWAYDHRELEWKERQVVEVYELLHRGKMATVQVQGETLRATEGHPFWVVRGEGLADRPIPVRIAAYESGGRQEGRWVLARDLQVGDEVLLRQGQVVALESVQLDEVEEDVYNFHVADLQNYAVGACGVLVHNTNDPPTAANSGGTNSGPTIGDAISAGKKATGTASARADMIKPILDKIKQARRGQGWDFQRIDNPHGSGFFGDQGHVIFVGADGVVYTGKVTGPGMMELVTGTKPPSQIPGLRPAP